MAEYHVGCGIAGIYAGTLKNGKEWLNKSCVTDEALVSVIQYLVENSKEVRFNYRGKAYVLVVTERSEDKKGSDVKR